VQNVLAQIPRQFRVISVSLSGGVSHARSKL
jgi:hypothetical protein